jgi:hypothetical protein
MKPNWNVVLGTTLGMEETSRKVDALLKQQAEERPARLKLEATARRAARKAGLSARPCAHFSA